MSTSSNGNIFYVTVHLCGEFTGPRWILRTKASDAELWCFSLICAWINGWVNNREAGDLRRHCAYYDVIVMPSPYSRFACTLAAVDSFVLGWMWNVFHVEVVTLMEHKHRGWNNNNVICLSETRWCFTRENNYHYVVSCHIKYKGVKVNHQYKITQTLAYGYIPEKLHIKR